ncbi:MAG TPA: hypothetical protein VD948_00215 [Rhodothermales bacterium]|nr:hypothetical protein [Rhodothermales bacterium]
MDTGNTIHSTSEKLKVHTMLSAILTVAGLALMTFMIVVEDEPGALPLLSIVIGTAWYFLTRARIRSLHR